MTEPALSPDRWQELLTFANEFTCYSAAVATWSATAEPDWARSVNVGLALTMTEPGDGLLGFSYFPAGRRAELGLVRRGTDDAESAIDAVLAEVGRRGGAIVAGDGFHLPWHVVHRRVHAPHWFVLLQAADGLEVADPFACRNEYGLQEATRHPVDRSALPGLLSALPGDDPIHRLREVLALGDETTDEIDRRYQWFEHGELPEWHRPTGAEGPAGIELLARHFHEHGQELDAYSQADDIWSIARHRAFLAALSARAADADATAWATEHAAPLAKRWAHIAPLIMQASLALKAGRSASTSVPETLEELAVRERDAARAAPDWVV